VSKAQEWREKADAAAETFIMSLPLPSGMVVRARRPGPLRLAKWNRLPIMIEAVGAKQSLSDADVVELMEYLRELLIWCVVDPPIAVDGGPEAVHPRDIPERDMWAIANWAMRMQEAEDLRPFRRERTTDGVGEGGRDILVPSVATAGDCGPGGGADAGPGGDAAGDGSGTGSH